MARRGAGEGSVFQLADGRWRAQIEVANDGGPRRRRTTTVAKRRDAAEWLRKMQDLQAQNVLPTKSVTVNAWFETFLHEVARPSVRPSTLQGYRRDFERHISPSVGSLRLEQLQPAHLQKLYQAKLESGLSPNSVRLIHSTLRRSLKVGMRWGVVARNVALLVDPPAVPRYLVEPLGPAEARAVLEAARGDRLEVRWILAISLGPRQGEVLGLWWPDLDFRTGDLRIVRQLARRRDPAQHDTFSPLKTSRSVRTVRLPKPLLAKFAEHRERQQDEIAAYPGWGDERLIFTTPIGTPLDHSNDARAFAALLKRAGVRRVRLHDLRHTAASLLLADGVHPRVVMQLPGHSQIGLTMNTYSHVMPSMLGEAADAVEGLLWDTTEEEGSEDARG